ncbi:MAG TPA: carbonic anhydrase [Polyangiaceae bacterium]|nr:carbonic anhydrase [Polyangiaceae bacterium]
MPKHDQAPPPKAAAEALAALRAGNTRFAQNVRSIDSLLSQARRDDLAAGQSPFAIVLSCSDSRVPAEIVFDCGLGDLFVVRVAGNVVAPSLVGSVEFAAAKFGTELVVVMGHTGCGAIAAALDALLKRGETLSDNVRDIVDRITPSVVELVAAGLPEAELVRAATRANIRNAADHMRHGSRVLEQRIAQGKLFVVGAEYDLRTGAVDFFDLPASVTAAT